MVRRLGLLLTLAPIGVASLVYVVLVRGFLGEYADHGLAWPLLGILPTFVFGMWLLTVTSARSAVFIAVAATAMAMGSAYEVMIQRNVEWISQPWFPLFNTIGLTADAVSTAGFISLFATFPTGVPERRWQRVAVWLIWIPVLVGPLALFAAPEIILPTYAGVSAPDVPNPFAVPGLAWAAPAAYFLAYNWVGTIVIGLGVLYFRALFGDPEVRMRTRVMTWVVTASLIAFGLWSFFPTSWIVAAAVFITLLAIPLAGIHGILRYGAFDIAPDDRGRLFARSSSLLITVLYGIAVATPVLLLEDSFTLVGAVLLTTLLAIGLLPVRGWLERWIHRAVFGDRERQLTMLSELGTRLEQAVDPDELLTRLAEAVREGLDATWTRITLAGRGDTLAAAPTGVAGEPVGDAVTSCDLVRGDEVLGRIELGPRQRGDYADAERALLRTVAGQAAASVANVRLTAQLAAQLDELTASRERLVAAQDDERKRLERDLHDGIQQNVVAQIAGLRLARNRLQRGELTAADLVELQDQERETLTELRELARGIHPPVLSDNGLVAAVESGVARFPIPLIVEADERLRAERFAEDVETTAYYVVREALANTAKHANATRASVGLAHDGERLRIEISDDGCGIRTDGKTATTSGGLANIRDRVAALRGTMRVTPNRPSGTTVLVDLPVEREAAPVG